MNLIDTKVKHKEFGEGTIIIQRERYITVQFQESIKVFQYPNVFGKFLQHTDSDIAYTIKQEIEKLNEVRRTTPPGKDRGIPRKNKPKFFPRKNIAFKCNFCNGGHTNNRIGFYGVCSDDVIRNNIQIDKRVWCSDTDCSCGKYLAGELSRSELDDICTEGGFVCYESQMLRDWRAMAGFVQTGKRKGSPMTLKQVQNNSLCVLTTRDPNSSEKQRYIFAVFLVDHPYNGDNQEEGYVSSKSVYRIELSPKEAHKMLYWNYHSNTNQPEVAVWSSGLHRYFEDDEAMQILRDIAKLKIDTKDEVLANDFLRYFSETTGIEVSDISPNQGALQKQAFKIL